MIASNDETIEKRQLFVYLLLFICTLVFLAHLPALSARATYLDDHEYVFQNSLVQNPSWASVRRFFVEVWRPSTVPGYYQPLTMTSLMLDRAVGGRKNPMRVYHRTSLVLHVTNTALVAVFLYVLFGQPFIAAGVSLLFGLHPITVESVCWISERKTVLASLFALWSLISYVQYTRDSKRRHYMICVLAYVLALLSKPITVPLPVMMLLMDCWPLNRQSRIVKEKIPFFVIGGVFSLITCISQSLTAHVRLPGHYNPLHAPLILCHNIVFYLYKIIWPANLIAYYDSPLPMSLSHPLVLIGILGTSVLVSVLLIVRRWTWAPLVGWTIFFAMIFPAMGILRVTTTIVANRYVYLPSIGLLMLLTALLVRLGRTKTEAGSDRGRHVMAVMFVLILAGIETIPMRRYQSQWAETRGLHQYMLAISPQSPGINNSMGAVLTRMGHLEDALQYYRVALDKSPDNASMRYNLAVTLQGISGKTDEAITQYKRVLEGKTKFTLQTNLNLGNLYLRKGQVEESISCYREAFKIKNDSVIGHLNLGKTLILAGQPEEGLKHLRKAVQISPEFLPALKSLSWALATHPDERIRDPNEAISLANQMQMLTRGRDVIVLDSLAAAYACDGQFIKAVDVAQKARQMIVCLRNHEMAGDIEERLRLYGMNQAYLTSVNYSFR